MRLKSLELYGFKSFADRTDFSFDAGITALVGPNGSGKSNVVDAVRWILGEQRAKSLRGKEMLDVIFAGAPTRAATGYAEAALTFSNEDGLLPIDFPEVKLARRLYRDGTSEYMINDNVSRLKDIKNLLMDTGVGTSAYSIMEQGRIDSILRANPADRRAIFEEAAGISKFKARRKETIRKLERVDQNLLRLADITEEVQRRLRSLKIQAGKARRFQEYDTSLRELRSRVSRHDYFELKQRILESEQALQSLRTDRESAAALRDDLEAAIQERETELREVREHIETTRAERSRREADHRAAEERLGMLQRRLEELQEESLELEERVSEVRVHCESQRQEEQEAIQEAATAQTHLEEKESARAEYREQVAEIESELHAIQEERGESERSLESARAEETRWRNRGVELTSEINGLEERCDRLTEEVAAADSQREELAREATEAEEALTASGIVIGERREKTLELAERLGELKAGRDDLETQLERSGAEVARLTGRRDGLAEALEHLESVSGGAKALVEAAEKGVPELSGVVGLLANLVRVEPEHVAALESSLGDRLDGIVVRDDAAADAALEYLQENRLGVATLLVADGASGRRVRRAPREKPSSESERDPSTEIVSAQPDAPVVVAEPTPEPVPELEMPAAETRTEKPRKRKGLFRRFLSIFGIGKEEEESSSESIEASSEPVRDPEAGRVEPAASEVEASALSELPASQAEETPPPVAAKPSGRIRRSRNEARRRATARIPGVIGPLVDLVQVEKSYQGLLEYLIGDFLLCEDATAARRVVASRTKVVRAVVTDGTLVPSRYELRGGSSESASGGVISQRSELESLDERIRLLQEQRDRLLGELETLEESIRAAEKELSEVSEALNAQELEAARLRAEAAAIRQRLERQQGEVETREQQRVDLGERREKLAAERIEAESEMAAVQERFGALEESLAQLAERGQILQRDRDDTRAKLTDLQVEVAQLQEKKQGLHRHRERVEESLRTAERERGRLQQALEDNLLRRDETTEELAQLRERLGELAQHIGGEDGTEQLMGTVQTFEAEVQERRRERTAIARRLEELDADIQTRSLGEREARVRAEDLRERLAEELEIDLEEAIAEYVPEPEALDLGAMRREIEELRGKMARLGPVNLEAIEELDEVEERARFYEEQQGDLDNSKKSLQDILKKINTESRERFEKTFYAVRDHFREIFRKLFGGGRADVILEEGEDLLEAGIEVIAKPPGKEPRTLDLLSGGERTMTAVALLFALFKFRPSPFCILDEVDAALDEANIDRFLGMLEGFLDQSQFLVITHSKRTMTAADILYGVTMEEAGVSKRIAIKFEDIEDIRVA